MPKIKTNKAAKKRFHITGSGKVMRTKGPKSHLRRKKAKRVKRLFGGKVELSSSVISDKIKNLINKFWEQYVQSKRCKNYKKTP